MVYVVRDQNDLLGVICGTLLSNQLHSKYHGLVEVVMISLTPHDRPLLKNDNGDVYDRMNWSLSGSQYTLMIAWFRKK